MIADKLKRTAARWFIRMRDAEPDSPERTKFEAWLMESPIHQHEYESFAQSWDDIDSLPQLTAMAKAKEVDRFMNKERSAKKVKNAAATISICIIVFFMSLAGIYQYQEWQASPIAQIASLTEKAQITTSTLEDGTEVTLNANSNIEVTYYRNRRHVHLHHGEAIFKVAKDPNRPFVVETDTTIITVLGTRFAVNKLSQFVRVSVEHGQVRVESKNASDAKVLYKGDVVEVPNYQAIKYRNYNAADYFKFASGVIVFNESDIHEIAEVLSRFRKDNIVVKGTSQERISAVIDAKDTETFINTLPKIANLQVIDKEHHKTIQLKD
jgi:transmembrane sensor